MTARRVITDAFVKAKRVDSMQKINEESDLKFVDIAIVKTVDAKSMKV
jgi:hypothetical protein